MKLKTLIDKLEKARQKYVEKHGTEPVIQDLDYEGLHLCKKVNKAPGIKVFKAPYLTIKTGLEENL